MENLHAIFDLIHPDKGHLQDFQPERLDFFKEHLLSEYYLFLSHSPGKNIENENSLALLKARIDIEIINEEFSRIISKFDNQCIDYRVIKGFSIACVYPELHLRRFSDIDLMVRVDDLSEAKAILESQDYKIVYEKTDGKDVVYNKEGAPTIELHHRFFDSEDASFEQCLLKEAWDSKHCITIGSKEYFTLEPDVQFRYMIIHLKNHLLSSGCGLRFLLDLYFFCKYYKLDLFSHIEYFKKVGLSRLYEMIIISLNKYFYMDIEKPLETSFTTSEIESFAGFIIDYGLFGKAHHESEMDNNRVIYRKAQEKSLFKIVEVLFFPNVKNLDERFSYAKRNLYLLPLAWVHRVLLFLFVGQHQKYRQLFVKNESKFARKKLELLKMLQL